MGKKQTRKRSKTKFCVKKRKKFKKKKYQKVTQDGSSC